VAAEARTLGVNPALWAYVKHYWAQTTSGNRAHPLVGYPPGTLTRRDFATLAEGQKLTGDIINEVGRRITRHAPHVAFLDSTFLHKVAPTEGVADSCTHKFWTSMVGKGAESTLGTAKEVIITPHCVPDHWCCATVDLRSKKLAYYDPFYTGPYRTRALDALSSYIDQAHTEQARAPVDTASFERPVYTTPRQPDGVSCGVCVLAEIQRIADRGMESRRNHEFTETELSRCRAYWACAIIDNPPLDPQQSATAETEKPMEPEEPGPIDADRRNRHPPAGGAPAARKRQRTDMSRNGRQSAETKRRRHDDQMPGETTAHTRARADGAGIPAQELSVGEKIPPDKQTGVPP
jgi:hypothetical protein